MSFCPSCGTRHAPGARFCENCGTPAVAPPPAEQPTAQQPVAPQPTAPQPTAPQPTLQQPPFPTAPSGRGGNRRTVLASAGAVVAVGVLGTVGWFVYDALSGPAGGADSPSAAVLGLASAASAEDPVAALSLLPPDEVGPLVEVYRDVEAKAADGGLVSSDAPLAGFDVDVDGVEVQEEELGGGVAAVTVTSGRVTWEFDPEQLQGPLQREPDGDLRRPTSGSEDLVEISREATDGAPLKLMTIERDGRWYVSPAYTLLEAWRVSEGLPAPDFSTDLDSDSTGAESATAAVEGAVYAATAYDVQGLMDLLSPDEAAAVHHYRDAIMTALNGNEDWADLREDVQFGVDRLDLSAGEERDGRVPVTVRSAAGWGSSDDDYATWSLDGNCVTATEDGDTESGCLDEFVDEAFGEGRIGRAVAAEIPRLMLLTSEHDGRWYVDPLATIVGSMRDAVGGLDGDDVLTLLDVRQYGSVTGKLESGGSVDGTLDAENGDALYEMPATAGEALTFCIDGDEAWGQAFAPDGRLLAGATAAPAEDGSYRLLVQGEPGASYTATGEVLPIEALALPADVDPSGGGACGVRVFSFEAVAGEPVLLEEDGGDGYVEVTSPSGETGYGAVFVPSESGTHYVTTDADAYFRAGSVPEGLLVTGDSDQRVVGEDGTVRFSVFLEEGTGLAAYNLSSYSRISLSVLQVDGQEVDYDSDYGDLSMTSYVDQPGIYDVVVSVGPSGIGSIVELEVD